MKVGRKIIIFFAILIFTGTCFGYDNYGFTSYRENRSKIEYKCSEQCYILLGGKKDINYINLNGNIVGNGNLFIGVLLGEQISLLKQRNIINKKSDFENIDLYSFSSQIAKDAKYILLFDGETKGILNLDIGKAGLLKSIGIVRNQFRAFKETYTPYSINLRNLCKSKARK